MKMDLSCDAVRAGRAGPSPDFAIICFKCRRPSTLCKSFIYHHGLGYVVFLTLFGRVTHFHTGKTGQLRFIGAFDPERNDWPCIVRYQVTGGTHDRASSSLLSYRPAGRRKPRPDKVTRHSRAGRRILEQSIVGRR